MVESLVCVQAQDAPLARWSLGMRLRGVDDDGVRAALDSGRIVRTHILRPTWHFVRAEDLRWILDLTSAKVISGLAGRHRQLGLDEHLIDRIHGRFVDLLGGETFLTRRQIAQQIVQPELDGPPLGHLLLLAELRGLICSGPVQGRHHTYALTAERIPATVPQDRPVGIRELVRRFFSGHGPAAVTDLTRWTTVTQTEVKVAIAELGDELASRDVEGTTQWYDPSRRARSRHRDRVLLLPTFDEAYLSYTSINFSRVADHPCGDEPQSFAESGGGIVICDLRDAGRWKRRETGGVIDVTVSVSSALSADHRDRIAAAVDDLAAFVGKRPHLRFAAVGA